MYGLFCAVKEQISISWSHRVPCGVSSSFCQAAEPASGVEADRDKSNVS